MPSTGVYHRRHKSSRPAFWPWLPNLSDDEAFDAEARWDISRWQISTVADTWQKFLPWCRRSGRGVSEVCYVRNPRAAATWPGVRGARAWSSWRHSSAQPQNLIAWQVVKDFAVRRLDEHELIGSLNGIEQEDFSASSIRRFHPPSRLWAASETRTLRWSSSRAVRRSPDFIGASNFSSTPLRSSHPVSRSLKWQSPPFSAR